jgi:hypothetical protein
MNSKMLFTLLIALIGLYASGCATPARTAAARGNSPARLAAFSPSEPLFGLCDVFGAEPAMCPAVLIQQREELIRAPESLVLYRALKARLVPVPTRL